MKNFGKYVIVVFIAIGVFVVLDMLTGIATSFENIRITYSEPFLIFFSVTAGPIAGAVAGFISQLIVQVQNTVLDWPMSICTVLNCLAIGYFTRSIEINDGLFEKKEIFLYNRVQITANILIWVLIYPLLSHYLFKKPLIEVFRYGILTSVHFVISCMLLGTLFLAIFARTRLTPQNFYRN